MLSIMSVSASGFSSGLITTPAMPRTNVVMQEVESPPPPVPIRPVPMGEGMDLSSTAAQKRIAVAVDAADRKLKGWAMTKAMFKEGWMRAEDETLGAADLGPPFTEQTGIGWATSKEPKNREEMIAYAKTLNPVVGFWDPLNIINEETAPETIGWWRHAEIKHGRIAMAAFVGYAAHANGIHFPWNIQQPLNLWGPDNAIANLPTISFADIAAAGSPPDMWDAVPTAGKAQIFAVIAFLEAYGETSMALEADGQTHYVRGGKPGYYPKFKGRFPHQVPLELWDPFKFNTRMSAERKEEALRAEVNNGRLAMIGIFGLVSASKGLIVPGLDGLVESGQIARYSGEIMSPFSGADSSLPFVGEMAGNIGSYGW